MKKIPKGKNFRDRKTGAILPNNFELRDDELGTSVWQSRLITPEKILEILGTMKGDIFSTVVDQVVRDGFEVLDVPDEISNIPGHAEIRSGQRNLLELADRQILCELFQPHVDVNNQRE